MLSLLVIFNIYILLVMWSNRKNNSLKSSKRFNIKSFFAKVRTVWFFFYKNPKLFFKFILSLFSVACSLNYTYFSITGFANGFNIFIFVHRLFTVYPFIAIIAPALLIYLNPKAIQKPTINQLWVLGLNNISFTGFLLYLSFALFFFYTGLTGLPLILLSYFLPFLLDLFGNMPNILVDFIKLHSLTKNFTSLLKTPKVLYFSKTVYSLRSKVKLTNVIGSRIVVNSKFSPHLSLRRPSFTSSEHLIISGIAKDLVNKQVFRPICKIDLSLVDRELFKSRCLVTLSESKDLACLELNKVKCNKLSNTKSLQLEYNHLKPQKLCLDWFYDWLYDLDNNSYKEAVLKNAAKQNICVYMQNDRFAYHPENTYYVNNTPHLYANLVSDLNSGAVPRTPLLGLGETIETKPHGLYPVTGGFIRIGCINRNRVTIVLGVIPLYESLDFDYLYSRNNQPFNLNFACVLYELRAAGRVHFSSTSLDYMNLIEGQNRQDGLHIKYINGYRVSRGLPPTISANLPITDSLINGIAQ